MGVVLISVLVFGILVCLGELYVTRPCRECGHSRYDHVASVQLRDRAMGEVVTFHNVCWYCDCKGYR